MARLFVGQKEIDFFSDLTKEVIKDVAGQKIYYYTVREDLTDVHSIYEESTEKIFNPPIEVEALVEWQPSVVKATQFGQEQLKSVAVYLHPRDLFDRSIEFKEGDYFSFGPIFFEATSIIHDKIAYGQVERLISLKVTGKQTRQVHIKKAPIGPTSEFYSDSNAIQTTFEQQRGQNDYDVRQLHKDNVIDSSSITARKVSPDGTAKSINKTGTSFYGDD